MKNRGIKRVHHRPSGRPLSWLPILWRQGTGQYVTIDDRLSFLNRGVAKHVAKVEESSAGNQECFARPMDRDHCLETCGESA